MSKKDIVITKLGQNPDPGYSEEDRSCGDWASSMTDRTTGVEPKWAPNSAFGVDDSRTGLSGATISNPRCDIIIIRKGKPKQVKLIVPK